MIIRNKSWRACRTQSDTICDKYRAMKCHSSLSATLVLFGMSSFAFEVLLRIELLCPTCTFVLPAGGSAKPPFSSVMLSVLSVRSMKGWLKSFRFNVNPEHCFRILTVSAAGLVFEWTTLSFSESLWFMVCVDAMMFHLFWKIRFYLLNTNQYNNS